MFNHNNEQVRLADDERLSYYKAFNEVFSMIPLNGKEPIKSWKHAQTHHNRLSESDYYLAGDIQNSLANQGIITGLINKLLVFDLDDVAKFENFIKNFGLENPLPRTYTVSTGKGYHYYYRYPSDGYVYKSIAEKSQGFDVRAEGGYVVAPGSIHPETGAIYEVCDDSAIPAAPEWLKTHIKNKREHENNSNLPVSEDIKKLIINGAPKGNRSEAVMEVLIALVSKGVSDTEIKWVFDNFAIGERFEEKGFRKDKFFDLELQKAKNYYDCHKDNYQAYNNYLHPTLDGYKCTTLYDVKKMNKKIEWLIEGLWPKNESLVILGGSGVGKSTFALNMFLSMVTSSCSQFIGKFDINKSVLNNILIIQAENTTDTITDRQNSICSYLNTQDMELKRIFIPSKDENIKLTGDINSKLFQDMLAEFIIINDINIICIDPLSTYNRNDENDNSKMRLLLDDFSKLCDELKVTPCVIHHIGKSYSGKKALHSRGASAIDDWAANIIGLSPKKDNTIELSCSKARSYEKFKPATFELNNCVFSQKMVNTTPSNILAVVKSLQSLKNSGNLKITQTDLKNEIVKYTKSIGEGITNQCAVNWIKQAVSSNHISEQTIGRNQIYT